MVTDRKNWTSFVTPSESENLTALLIWRNFIHLKKSSWFGNVKVFYETRVTFNHSEMAPRTRRAQRNPAQSEPVLPGVQQVAGELAQAAVQQGRYHWSRVLYTLYTCSKYRSDTA